MLTRRGLIGTLLAAPAIIRTPGLLMPVKVPIVTDPTFWCLPYATILSMQTIQRWELERSVAAGKTVPGLVKMTAQQFYVRDYYALAPTT